MIPGAVSRPGCSRPSPLRKKIILDRIAPYLIGRDGLCSIGHNRKEALMGIESILVFLIVGAVAGWLAGLIVSGFGFGLIGNIVVGIIGALIAGYLFPAVGITLGTGILAAIIHSTIGAIILLVLIRIVKQA